MNRSVDQENLAGGELSSCHRFPKLAEAAAILRFSMKFARHAQLFVFLSACLACAGISHADTIQRRVAAGVNHSLTVKEDGTLWGWGSNDRGQLGIGSTVDQWFPAQVGGLSDVAAAAGGIYHSVAAKADR